MEILNRHFGNNNIFSIYAKIDNDTLIFLVRGVSNVSRLLTIINRTVGSLDNGDDTAVLAIFAGTVVSLGGDLPEEETIVDLTHLDEIENMYG